jgi:hypothetical protein
LIVKDLISAARGTDVELLVTSTGFVTSGHAPGGYSPASIGMEDICNLRYRQAHGGGEDREWPSGLYVELYDGSRWSPGVCMLPHLDEPQTKEVIDAILRRFPNIPNGPHQPSGLISLNLNKPRS